MRKFLTILLSIALVSLLFFNTGVIRADDEVQNLQKEIDALQHQLDLSKNATTPLESQVKDLEAQLASIVSKLRVLQIDLKKSEDDLVFQKQVLARTVRNYYIGGFVDIPLLTFFASNDATEALRQLAFTQQASREDRQVISGIGEKIAKLAADKKRFAVAQAQVDRQSQFLKGEIAKAKSFQSELEGKISALSARQQEIVAARSGQFTASIGDSELADDYNASIKGFRESAPSGTFAVFSFGAFTHRKGMSQYGARGRAEAGQDYKTILKAYYGKDVVGKDTGGSIGVSGFGEMNFETSYLYGIAEMPSAWNMNALKAQAVAARTYAYRYKQDGKEICTDEGCQVFSKSKSDSVPDSWKSAVDQTRGEVLEDVVTYYASTHGGYASPIGWDTFDGSGGSNFVDKSYDKAGGSPWVYKAWYTKGYSSSSDKCGKSNPWLTGEELADIINATRYRDDRVTPVTTSCWGGNPYSHAELREKSDGPSNVTGVSVSQGSGTTNQIVFQTDKGEISINGSDFKTAFNLRAPGYLSIPQSGFAFFNIEKK